MINFTIISAGMSLNPLTVQKAQTCFLLVQMSAKVSQMPVIKLESLTQTYKAAQV